MFQTGKAIDVNFLTEDVFGTPQADSASAIRFRASPASGLNLQKTPVMPTEFSSDGMSTAARHGSQHVVGQYECDLSVGTFDKLLEALFRSTFVASFTVTEAAMTSITTTSSTIVAAAGSWLTQGVRKGHIVRLTGHSTAANNSKNLRVLDVSASTITVPTGDLVADAVADSAFTLTVLKSLVQGTTDRSFTFEEVNKLIDKSQVFAGCRVVGATFRFATDQTVQGVFRILGQNMTMLTGGSSPLYTNPVISTAMPLVVTDGKLRVNGTDVTEFTSLEIDFDLGGAVQAVAGGLYTPDVFLNPAQISATLSVLREDFDNLALYANETTFDIHITCVETDTEPKDIIHLFAGQCKFMQNTKSIGGDNGLIETGAINIGRDVAGGANTQTMMRLTTSAA